MAKIVVMGAGIGGIPAAYALRERLADKDKVILISDRDEFHFVPSNPWVAIGRRQRTAIAFPIAPHLIRRGIEFIPQAANRILAEKNRILLADGEEIDYDYLLLATGVQPAFERLPGAREARLHSMIRLDEAEKAHSAYGEFLKQGGPIVVAAMPNASLLGPVYEYAFLLDADLRRRGLRPRIPITVVTPEPYPGHLGIGGESGQRLLQQALSAQGIDCICNARILKAEPGRLQIMEHEGAGQALPFAHGVLWPELCGVEAVAESEGLADERGLVEVDPYLASSRYPNVFAVGLCVSRPVLETPVPIGVPDTVYGIQQEVDYAVRNLLARLRGEALTRALPERARWLAELDEAKIAEHAGPQIPLRDINRLSKGRWIHEAKTRFEDYFINRIILADQGNSHIATFMRKAQAGRPVLPQLAARLEIPVDDELRHELQALAAVLGCPLEQMTAQLLRAAVLDAGSFLSDEMRAEVERTRLQILLEERPERQPGVEFEGGAP